MAVFEPHVEHAEPAAPQKDVLAAWQFWLASQHPAQLAALQVPPVHAPPTQVCAALQAGPMPHRQAPAAVQESALPAVHGVHVVPGAAQNPSASVVQVLPTQHPAAQEVASQTQAPPTQRWPVAQAAVAPQLQVPPVPVQPSARLAGHAPHAAPAAPQVEAVSAVQVSPAQQPEGHEAASHWQPPTPQLCPAPHCASVPQRQAPLVEQALAFDMSHAAQLAPAAPQALPEVGELQPPSAPQQPPAHEVASHTHALLTHR